MVESHRFPSVSPSYNYLFLRENVFFLFLYSSLKSFQFRSLKVGLTKLDNYSPQGFTGCDEETTGPTRVYRRKLSTSNLLSFLSCVKRNLQNRWKQRIRFFFCHLMQNEIIQQLLHVVLGVLLLPRRSLFRNNPCTLRCFVRCGSDLHDARRANHCLSRVVEPLVVVLNLQTVNQSNVMLPAQPLYSWTVYSSIEFGTAECTTRYELGLSTKFQNTSAEIFRNCHMWKCRPSLNR